MIHLNKTGLLVVLCGLLIGPFAAWAGPCQLITQDEAKAIIGDEMKPPRLTQSVGMAAGSRCQYFTAAPLHKRGATGSVSLLLYEAEAMKKAESMYTSPKEYFQRTLKVQKSAKSAKIEEINNLGDQAFWQGGSNRLHILINNRYVILKISDKLNISSQKGMSDLHAKISAHWRKVCEKAARQYILPRLKGK
jgi:hypothetical protein